MKENLIDYLFKEWAKNFYTSPLLIISQISLLITFYKTKQSNIKLAAFKTYAIAGILLFLVGDIINYFTNGFPFRKFIVEILNYFFTFTEIVAFGIFYSHYIKTKKISQLISIFIILVITVYSALLIYIPFNNQSISETNAIFNKIVFIELIFWGLLSVLFYFELFKFYSNENLLLNPAFWVISFSLLYTLILPGCFLILEFYRIEEKYLFKILVSIHYLSLILVYLGIIKALKCNTPRNR